jgi:hypothetical protein
VHVLTSPPPEGPPPMRDSMDVLLAMDLRSPMYDFCSHVQGLGLRNRLTVIQVVAAPASF